MVVTVKWVVGAGWTGGGGGGGVAVERGNTHLRSGTNCQYPPPPSQSYAVEWSNCLH